MKPCECPPKFAEHNLCYGDDSDPQERYTRDAEVTE